MLNSKKLCIVLALALVLVVVSIPVARFLNSSSLQGPYTHYTPYMPYIPARPQAATIENGATFEAMLFNAMPTNQNFMVSPFSLRMALAMAANGATGTTQAEILTVLGIEDLDEFNQRAAATIASARNNMDAQLNIANSIWFNDDLFGDVEIGFSESYKNLVANYFAGEAQSVGANVAAALINNWVYEQTRGRIQDIVQEGIFEIEDSFEGTAAVLVNAIYFQGDWRSKFNPNSTRYDIFTCRIGVEHSIPIMQQTAFFDFYTNDYFKMMAMPYVDSDIRMYLVLPHVDEWLDFGMFVEAVDRMEPTNIRLRLPKFMTESTHDNLVEILQNMGMIEAFERWHTDFVGYNSMIYPTHVLGYPVHAWIGEVVQKTFIEVDEAGTEAAAATAVIMQAISTSREDPSPIPIPFYCTRPFIYFIRNSATGDILFMGEFAFAQ